MEHEVLIGTVKNRLQLEVNLNEKFYHIPEAVIPKDMLPVKYIALYLPANVFGENSGESCIRYYGRVAAAKVVRRSEITSLPARNGNINYYKFDVEEWLPLPNTVVRERGGIYAKAFTSLDKLLSAKKLSDIIDMAPVEVKRSSKPYFRGFTEEELGRIRITDEQAGAKQIAQRANDAAGKEKVLPVQITKYLLKNGYLEIQYDEVAEREVRVPTEKGKALGIENFWEINKFYHEYNKNYYDRNAQQFIVDHLNEIVMIKPEDAFKNK
ncbi:MAG: hypothetical protein ACI4IW_06315 [Oscillospiraceae bacterium]